MSLKIIILCCIIKVAGGETMDMYYDILNNLLKHNKNIKLEYREDCNILDILINREIVLSLDLSSRDIKEHSEIIYNSITGLSGVTMYIPKIYIKES